MSEGFFAPRVVVGAAGARSGVGVVTAGVLVLLPRQPPPPPPLASDDAPDPESEPDPAPAVPELAPESTSPDAPRRLMMLSYYCCCCAIAKRLMKDSGERHCACVSIMGATRIAASEVGGLEATGLGSNLHGFRGLFLTDI